MPAAALPEPSTTASVQPPGGRPNAPSPWRMLGVLLASLMMLLGSASTARAVDCNQEGTFNGVLQFIDFENNRVLVSDRGFGLDGDTEYEDAQGAQTQLENLFPGMGVEVRFCEQPGAMPVATRIRVRENTGSPTPTRTPGPTPTFTATPTGTPHPCDARVAGPIVSANAEAGTLHIASINTVAILVQTNENTEFWGLDGQALTFADFLPGLHAEAKGCIEQTPAGGPVLLAAEVRLLPTPSGTFTPTADAHPGPDAYRHLHTDQHAVALRRRAHRRDQRHQRRSPLDRARHARRRAARSHDERHRVPQC